MFFGFLFHFWFTIPIAAGATGLFVLCPEALEGPGIERRLLARTSALPAG
jgi:hypothetical protein